MRWPTLPCAVLLLLGCDVRTLPPNAPTFNDGVGEVLTDACGACHAGESAEGAYRVDSYLDSIACLPDGASPVDPADDEAPILVAIEDMTHTGLVDPGASALIRAWVLAGAPSSRGRAHAVGFGDPRSDVFHGDVLRAEGWIRVLDPAVGGACATCHEGAPNRAEGAGSVPSAPACTSCHDEPGGVFACSTCHGSRGRASPPRNPCFNPGAASSAGAHEAHLRLDCSVCHGERDIASLTLGEHGNGSVELNFDPVVAGADASFETNLRTCTNECHARGGDRPLPRWSPDEPSFDCNGCHTSPPASHYEGPCSGCHREANDDGTALTPGPLHTNGVVDLGDGSGTCAACHGAGDDPTPLTGSHRAHTSPTLTLTVGCEQCHSVPSAPLDAGHFDTTPGAEVVFGDRASARGSAPMYGADGSCTTVACHGAGLDGGSVPAPRWGVDDGIAGACGACHGVPPGPPHIASERCASPSCHGSEISYSPSGPQISMSGLAAHIDGRVGP